MTRLILLLAVVALSPLDALAKANPGLKQAYKLYERLLYNEAAAKLESVLAADDLEIGDRIAAQRLLGIVEVIRGDEDAARAAFAALLKLDPHATLRPTLSPKILDIFADVKEKHRASAPAPALDLPATPATPPTVTDPTPLETRKQPDDDGSTLMWAGIIGGGVVVVAAVITVVLLARGDSCSDTLGCEQMP